MILIGSKELSREELYEKIWSTPITQVAIELGISDVELVKQCKRLNIPKPTSGYWKKVAAGIKPRKKTLPLTPSEVFIEAAKQPVPKTLSLPSTDTLGALSVELMKAFKNEKPYDDKRIRIRKLSLPEVIVSEALADKTSKSFQAILNFVEPVGIPFRKAQGSYGSGYFQRGNDRLYLKIEEELVEANAKLDRPKRHSSWAYHKENQVPSGVLTFSLSPDSYGFRNQKQWKEDGKTSLELLLAQLVTEIRRHFVEAQKRRDQEVIDRRNQRIESERRWREYQEKEAIRRQEEQKRQHSANLETISQARSADLLKAAEWWRLHQTAVQFIDACEQRWRSKQSGEITTEQVAWLAWARQNLSMVSPFETDYPDPSKDGDFDPIAVPFGGPYPAKRDFPRPPTMPKIPPPVQQSNTPSGSISEPNQQYPFWLKYQGK